MTKQSQLAYKSICFSHLDDFSGAKKGLVQNAIPGPLVSRASEPELAGADTPATLGGKESAYGTRINTLVS